MLDRMNVLSLKPNSLTITIIRITTQQPFRAFKSNGHPLQFASHFQHLHGIPLPPMKELESSIIEVVELCTHYTISSLKTMVTKFTLSCDYFRQTNQLARLPDFHSILDSNAQSHRSGTFQAENEGKNLLLYNADILSCNYPFSGKHPRPGLEDAICALISQYEKNRTQKDCTSV